MPKPYGSYFSVVGEDIILPQKQSLTENNPSVDGNGELFHQSLLQREKVAAKPTDEVFLPPNRSQLVCRKCYKEWETGRRGADPYRGKIYTDEIF